MPEADVPPLDSLRPADAAFFARDPRDVAPDLLGLLLVSSAGGVKTGGWIVECEAYLGADDPGSHAATKAITKRNAIMYGPPGTVYVYFTYGNHHMINLVCGAPGVAGAVLVRAIEPLIGLDVIERRRGGRPLRELTNGPGKVAKALGIDLSDNGSRLGEGHLIVYDSMRPIPAEIGVSGRVGLTSGNELEYRYYLVGDSFVSRGRTGCRPAKRTISPRGETR